MNGFNATRTNLGHRKGRCQRERLRLRLRLSEDLTFFISASTSTLTLTFLLGFQREIDRLAFPLEQQENRMVLG